MWFRNLQLYRLGQHFDLSPEELEQRLQNQAYQGVSSMDMSSIGWVPPLGRHGVQLAQAINGRIMICLRKAEKIIPAGVVKQLVEDKVAEVEAAESRDVRRKEKLRIRDEIVVSLLPRALTKITDLYAYIDSTRDLIVVDAPSPSRAEDLITQLRISLGSLQASPVKVKRASREIMTRGLDGGRMPQGFDLGGECEQTHPDPEGGVINCKCQDLAAGEIRTHVKHGKHAVKLAIGWKQRVSCVLHEDLSIKRLQFDDVIREAEGDTVAEDPASKFDLDFSLMSLELAEFLPDVLDALGGEERPAE